jgi:uncharacterized membrane protein YadS
VILLAPMVAAAGIHQRVAINRDARNGSAGPDVGPDGAELKLPPVIPLFVIGFVAMVALRSTGWLAAGLLDAAAAAQDLLLGMALFGLGSAVRVRTLLHTGSRALLAALASWLLIAALGLGAAVLMIQQGS